MKTKIFLCTIIALRSSLYALSQVPQGFNYQAVATDGTGHPITSQIQVKIGFQTDTLLPSYLWEELHSSVQPNGSGLFSLVIGTGTRLSGDALLFSDIDWTTTPVWIKTFLKVGSDPFKYMGSARLWSVPYSLVAGEIGGPVNKLEVIGENELSDEALFEVRRKDGEIMFAVYNHGIRMNMPVDTMTKARKGGFAIGSFDKGKGTFQELFVVNPDSIRAYIDTNPGKATKGGFAIGGFSATKALPQEYLRVTRDSTRVYVRRVAKGLKGGFAIGGFDAAKADPSNFLDITPQNYLIGESSGRNLTTGLFNSFMGYETGKADTSGSNNVFLGYQAGLKNSKGNSNIFIGNLSGSENTTGNWNIFLGTGSGNRNTGGNSNVFIGNNSGNKNLTGNNNVFLGYNSGSSNTIGELNVFMGMNSGTSNTGGMQNIMIGYSTGYSNTTGENNVFIGYSAGHDNLLSGENVFIGGQSGYLHTTGNSNVFIGTGSGSNHVNGSSNVFIGEGSGTNNTNGDFNVFIGKNAGASETGDYKLYISSNLSAPNPLIYGDFLTPRVAINAKDPTQVLDVNGNARFRSVGSAAFSFNLNLTSDGTLTTSTSDISMKHGIRPIYDAIGKIMEMRGVLFKWNGDPTDADQLGMIAQEVETVIPEVVFTNPVDGKKGINYQQLSALFVEAFKEQQKEIESAKLENTLLRSELSDLRKEIETIKTIISANR